VTQQGGPTEEAALQRRIITVNVYLHGAGQRYVQPALTRAPRDLVLRGACSCTCGGQSTSAGSGFGEGVHYEYPSGPGHEQCTPAVALDDARIATAHVSRGPEGVYQICNRPQGCRSDSARAPCRSSRGSGRRQTGPRTRSALFTRVRGRRILGSPYTRSCIAPVI